MPEINEIRYGKDIGKCRGQYIWLTCPSCNKPRWVQNQECHRKKLCRSCVKKGHIAYNRGKDKFVDGRGYVRLYINEDNFFYPMASSKYKGRAYIFDHRLVMAKYLGRCLHSWEIVHHRNGIKDDNRIENLQLITTENHQQLTALEGKMNKLLEQNKELTTEIKLLRWELKQDSKVLLE